MQSNGGETLGQGSKIAVFGCGLFIMALGIAMSVRSGLGTTPVSTIPVAINAWLPVVSVGTATFASNVLFIIAQAALLRRDFPIRHLLQLPAIFVFGAAIDAWLAVLGGVSPVSWIARFALDATAIPVLAFGVWVCVRSRFLLMPGDGLAASLGKVLGVPFAWAKVGTDTAMVLFAAALGFATTGRATGVREGTLLAMLLVGSCVKLCDDIAARFLRRRQKSISEQAPRSAPRSM